jgi:hypothetical protein
MDYFNDNRDIWEMQKEYQNIPSMKEINKMPKKEIFKLLNSIGILTEKNSLKDVDIFLKKMNNDDKFYDKKND